MAEGTRAFVCGHPIAHSRSPLIHRYWLQQHGLPGSYDAIDIAPDAFAGFAASLAARGLAGGNVTIPHKEAAFAAAGRRDAAADAIGAVNTLWLEGDTLCGGNTDAHGFAANLDERAPGWDDGSFAVVLGAGGAARAVIHALKQRGFARIAILNRTVPRAAELAEMFGAGVEAHGYEAAGLLGQADLLVNTTSLGMHGEALPVQVDLLPDEAIVTDIVYVPLLTPLLEAAAGRGLRTVDGLGMLLHQAAPGFERWFGMRPQVTEGLRALVLADIEGRR